MKKAAYSLFIFCCIFWSSQVFAQTTLSYPKAVEILAINGKEVPKKRSSVQLPDGENQLLLRLVVNVGKRFDREMEYSETVIIKFSAAGAPLQLIVPKIKSAMDMRAFNRKINLTIVGAENTPIPFAKDTLIKSGFQLDRDYQQELADYNQTNGPAATALFAEQKDIEKSVTETPIPYPSQPIARHAAPKDREEKAVTAVNVQQSEPERPMALQMLLYWYKKADNKTRNEFLQIIQKEAK